MKGGGGATEPFTQKHSRTRVDDGRESHAHKRYATGWHGALLPAAGMGHRGGAGGDGGVGRGQVASASRIQREFNICGKQKHRVGYYLRVSWVPPPAPSLNENDLVTYSVDLVVVRISGAEAVTYSRIHLVR